MSAAATAPSCLLRPRPGDRVLRWRSGAGRVVVAVLERDGGGATVVSIDAYVGGPFPEVRVGLRVDGREIPPAALDGGACLGGVCVLGRRAGRRTLPITAA